MSTFITTLEASGDGPRLAIKDLIDLKGTITTAGSKAVERVATVRSEDAALLAGARRAGARIVGKTNLYELAFGASGVNPHYGTPRNPIDSTRLPGGSSSGSATAVAEGLADVAYGSDTGGSIRVPSAFCGVVGLKTTFGRVPLEGVWPLSPSLDTVGPMARDVEGVVLGMTLLEPGFQPGPIASSIGLIGDTGVPIDPEIESAIVEALYTAELPTTEVRLPEWMEIFRATEIVLCVEATRSNRALKDDPSLFSMLSPAVQRRMDWGQEHESAYAAANARRVSWQERLDAVFSQADLCCLPTVEFFPPPLEEAYDHTYTHLTNPFNFAGCPALSLPVPTNTRFPAGLQLVGPSGAEEMLCATAALIERAIAR